MRQQGKRIILLCTGILMLALSVLPHHHHCDGTIRFSVVERCDDCRNEPSAADHHHPETNNNNCDVRQLFVISGRDNSSHDHCLCHGHDFHPVDYFVFTLLYQDFSNLSPQLDGSRVNYLPFVAALHTVDATGAFALRGPPSFIA